MPRTDRPGQSNKVKAETKAAEVISPETNPEEVSSTEVSEVIAPEVKDNAVTELSPEETVNGVTDETVNSDNAEAVTGDAEVSPEEAKSDKEEATKAEAEEAKAKANPFFPLEKLAELKFANPMASAFLTQIIMFRNQVLDWQTMVANNSFSESEDGVVKVANDLIATGNEDVKSALQTYVEAKAYMEKTFKDLTTTVKADPSISAKSPEEITTIKGLITSTKKQIADAIKGMETFEGINPGASIKDAMDWVATLPELPGTATKSSSSLAKGSTGTPRPRLNNGYVMVEEKTYDSITNSMKAIKTASGKTDLTVPVVYEAWLAAASKATGKTISDWPDVPVDNEYSFKIGETDVTIKRTADTSAKK